MTRRPHGRVAARHVLGASVLLALVLAPLAGAGTGDTLREGQRNPKSGDASRETQIISGTEGYSTRQSNKSDNGGGAIYGCRSGAGGTPADNEPCLRANNLSDGLAFELNARRGLLGGTIMVGDGGDTTRPFTTNATGVATGLNADRVDGLEAAQILTAARAKAGLAAETADSATTAASAQDAEALGGKALDQVAMGAVLDEDGTLVRGSGASNAARNAVGDYRVTFNRSLSECAVQATIGRPEESGVFPDPGAVVTGRQFAGQTRAVIQTFDLTGAASDRPVAVTVTC